MKNFYTNPVIDLLFLGGQGDVITTSATWLNWVENLGENDPEQIIIYKEYIGKTTNS